MKKLKKCQVCNKYTLKEKCCASTTVGAHPPKFSPQDKYAHYRRKAKGLEV